MLLTELDGFLTGVLICPDDIMSAEWLRHIWGADDGDVPPFDDPADVQWFADAVLARYNEISRDLGRGKPQPIFDIDERNGDVLWEMWIDGFAQAMEMRPDTWAMLAAGETADAAQAISRLTSLIAVARDESDLDSMQINAMQDQAPAVIVEDILRLHTAVRRDGTGSDAPQASGRAAKLGRNDPCACGSGRKFKRCCG